MESKTYLQNSRNISSLIQFARSDSNKNSISNIFICGVVDGEQNLFAELTNMIGIQTNVIPTLSDITYRSNPQTAQIILSDYIYNVGNLIRL